MRKISILLLQEIRESFRSRWFIAVTAIFCAMALGVSYLSFSGAAQLSFAGFHRTVASLLNLVLIFVPLVSMLVASISLAGDKEDGTLAYVLSQPLSRASVYFAKIIGQACALSMSVLLGLALAAIPISMKAGNAEISSYGILALSAVLLSFSSLGMGFLIGAITRDRMRAIVAVFIAWITFSFAVDFLLVGLAVGGGLNPQTLFWISLINPVQQAKVLSLLHLTQRLEILGPSGIYAAKTFGLAGATFLMLGILVAWGALASAWGYIFFRKSNL